MKRDAKVGLLVAAVVCGVAAILLGGGLAARPTRSQGTLRVSEQVPAGEPVAESDGAAHRDASPAGALPEGLAEGVLPPAEPAEDGAPAELSELAAAPSAAALPALSLSPPEGAPGGAAPRALPPVRAISERPDDWRDAAPSAGAPAGAPRGLPLLEPAQELEGPSTTQAEPPVAPPAKVVALSPPARHVYVVQEGDSFYSISKKLFGTVRYFHDIQKANPDVDPKKLRPGMRVAIPEVGGATLRKELLAPPEPPKRKVILAQDKMHVVQPGEVLEEISLKYYGTKHRWQHILRANPTISDPKDLKPGREIVIPALTE